MSDANRRWADEMAAQQRTYRTALAKAEQERDAARDVSAHLAESLTRTEAQRDAAVADNAALVEALRLLTPDYDDGWKRQAHEEGCPWLSDETEQCECDGEHIVSTATLAREQPHPGAAQLEQHRKELVRARNEGLEKAAAELRLRADVAAEYGHHKTAEVWRNAASVVTVLKEPEE